ncbi:MAG: nuclear transport factor 2 family protein [Bacteroidota bacterium]
MKKMTFVLFVFMGLFSSCIYSQTKQDTITNQEIVEKFLNGFNDSSKIGASLALLAEDYHFKNPMVQLNSKAEFIALAQEMGKVLTAVNVIRISENNDWVSVFYEFKSSIPGLESNLGTEWFRVENGIIKESHLIYDASEWRKVYAQMEK